MYLFGIDANVKTFDLSLMNPLDHSIVEGDLPTLYFALMFAGWFTLRLKCA